MKKIPVIAVVGATASGKTAMAVELAKIFNGEVISADSMQIYKGMDIATAKPSAEEMDGIPHHLIDFLPVTSKYSVAQYIADAAAAAGDIISRSKVPIIAGGTGLYIDSFIDNIVFEDEPDSAQVRQKLKEMKAQNGIEALYDTLKAVDPDAARQIHINNEKRVMRALEVYFLTGETLTARQRRSRAVESPYEAVFIGLDYRLRSKLYDRINRRVDNMIENGLVKEAQSYYNIKDADTASQAIGYKELAGYLEGDLTLEQAAENLKAATRRYAKRQLTWFRRNERINWIYCDELDSFQSAVNRSADIIEKSGLFKRREDR